MRRLLAIGFTLGCVAAAIKVWRSRIPTVQRDRRLRRLMNERLAPMLVERGVTRGEHAATGIIEHVGRTSGTVRRTLVHPIPLGDRFAVPLPYGEGAPWPRNVLAAGGARLEYRGRSYVLVNPRAMAGPEITGMPRSEALIGRLFGGRFLVAHVESVTEGGLDPVAA